MESLVAVIAVGGLVGLVAHELVQRRIRRGRERAERRYRLRVLRELDKHEHL